MKLWQVENWWVTVQIIMVCHQEMKGRRFTHSHSALVVIVNTTKYKNSRRSTNIRTGKEKKNTESIDNTYYRPTNASAKFLNISRKYSSISILHDMLTGFK